MLLLLLAAILGGLVGLAISLSYGLGATILGAIVGGVLGINLAGAWLVVRNMDPKGDAGAMDLRRNASRKEDERTAHAQVDRWGMPHAQ